jgi:large subunit ribosomal protein L25
MEYVELAAQKRPATGKEYNKKIRRQGIVPAVLYGQKMESQVLQLVRRDVEKILGSKLGANTLIHLTVQGAGDHKVMIKDYSGEAISRDVTHVDFIAINENQDLHVNVPVHLSGKPAGVTAGGLLEHITRRVALICKPGRIPTEVLVDVTGIGLGKSLHLADVALPEGTRVAANYNPTIAAVHEPREEVVVAPVAAAEGVAPAEGATPVAAAGAKPAAGAAAAPAAAGDKKADDKKADKKK